MTTYRFHGSTDPRGRTKLPLLASVPAVDTDAWTVQLYEPIDSWGGVWGTSAAEVAEALRGVPDTADLLLRINSPGGEVQEAVAIATMLQSRSGRVDVRVDGWACSAASYLATLGETVTMGADSMLMIHKPWGATVGDDATHLASADLLAKVGLQLARAYAAKSGQPIADMLAAMGAETWYTADEAIAAGLADVKLGDDAAAEELPTAALAGWSLWTPPAAAVPPVQPAPQTPAAGNAPTSSPTSPPPAPEPPEPAPAPVLDLAAFRAGVLTALKGAQA